MMGPACSPECGGRSQGVMASARSQLVSVSIQTILPRSTPALRGGLLNFERYLAATSQHTKIDRTAHRLQSNIKVSASVQMWCNGPNGERDVPVDIVVITGNAHFIGPAPSPVSVSPDTQTSPSKPSDPCLSILRSAVVNFLGSFAPPRGLCTGSRRLSRCICSSR